MNSAFINTFTVPQAFSVIKNYISSKIEINWQVALESALQSLFRRIDEPNHTNFLVLSMRNNFTRGKNNTVKVIDGYIEGKKHTKYVVYYFIFWKNLVAAIIIIIQPTIFKHYG